MTTIVDIHSREVLDSRGHPTVEAEVRLSDGATGGAMVPSGASTGTFEAMERRDGDQARFYGRGVLNAVVAVQDELAPALSGKSPFDQAAIDEAMVTLDGTPNKSRLGANAILAVSMAVAKAASASQKLPLYQYLAQGDSLTLPVPMFNILNGGRHARNSTDIQEFMVAPAGVDTFAEALRAGAEIYHALGRLLVRLDQSTTVGDEGGFAPSLASNKEALDLVVQAISEAGYRPGEHCVVALDVAASELMSDGQYDLARESRRVSSGDLTALYEEWTTQYPIVSIEDGLDEEDWAGWQALTSRLGGRVQLVGDDLLVTNVERIQRAIQSWFSQRPAGEAQPSGHPQRDPSSGERRQGSRLGHRHEPPLGRDGGHYGGGPSGGLVHRADQGRCALSLGTGGQVQPPAANRRRTGATGHLRRGERIRPFQGRELDSISVTRSTGL